MMVILTIQGMGLLHARPFSLVRGYIILMAKGGNGNGGSNGQGGAGGSGGGRGGTGSNGGGNGTRGK